MRNYIFQLKLIDNDDGMRRSIKQAGVARGLTDGLLVSVCMSYTSAEYQVAPLCLFSHNDSFDSRLAALPSCRTNVRIGWAGASK